MATFSLPVSDTFAAVATVGAYPESNWPAHKLPPTPGVAPVGSATQSVTVASTGLATFDGLAEDTTYYLSTSDGARYIRFRVDAAEDPDEFDAVAPYVNPKDPRYGAVGNDSTDDLAALTAAHDAAGPGGTVSYPEGTYAISDKIPITHAGQTVLGNGATIRMTGASKTIFDVQEVADCTFDNFILKTDVTKAYFGNPNYRADSGYVENCGLWIGGGCDRTRATNIRVQGFVLGIYVTNYKQSTGTKTGYVQGVSIEDVDVSGCDQGLLAIGTDGLQASKIRGSVTLSQGNFTYSGTRTNGSPTIPDATILTGGGPAAAGMSVTGTGIPGGTTVVSLVGSTLTLSANASSSGAGTLTISGNSPNPGHVVYVSDSQPNKNLSLTDIEGADGTALGHLVTIKGVTGGTVKGLSATNFPGVLTVRGSTDMSFAGVRSVGDLNDSSNNGCLYVQDSACARLDFSGVSIESSVNAQLIKNVGVDITFRGVTLKVAQETLVTTAAVVDGGTRPTYDNVTVVNTGAGGGYGIKLTSGSYARVRGLRMVNGNRPGQIDSGVTNALIEHDPELVTVQGGTNLWVNNSLAADNCVVHRPERASALMRGLGVLHLPQAPGWVGKQAALSASRSYFFRAIAPRTMNVLHLAFYLSSTLASADDLIDYGLYDAAGARIWTYSHDVNADAGLAGKLNATASVAGKQLAMTQTLLGGKAYYVGFAQGAVGGTAAQVGIAEFTPGGSFFQVVGQTAGVTEAVVMAAQFPLPATITFGGGSTTQFPALALLEV